MGEVVTLSVGHCGGGVLSAFWASILPEHGISDSGVAENRGNQHDCTSSFFSELPASNRFVPRCVLVDLEPSALDEVREGRFGELFSPESFVRGCSGAGNNWAKARSVAASVLESVMEAVRSQTERCDCLQGFQMMHALGGGTGSGLGSLVLENLHDEHAGKIFACHTVSPSLGQSSSVLEPYNSVLGFNDLIELADQCFLYSNAALYEICQHQFHEPSATLGLLNDLIGRSINITTAGIRFPGADVFGMRKMALSTVPFPRLHFLLPSLAPLTYAQERLYESHSVHEILKGLFNPRHSLCRLHGSRTEGTIYVAAACVFRGVHCPMEIEQHVLAFVQHHPHEFVDYIPNNIAVSAVQVPEQTYPVSGLLLANSSGIVPGLKALSGEFSMMLRRKAYVFAYTDEGMDELEFYHAHSNLQDLICEYEQFSHETALSPNNDPENDKGYLFLS